MRGVLTARWTELALAAVLLGAAAALALAARSDPERSGTLEQRAHAVAETLKCPVCHDLSAADSPAPAAQQMRSDIEAELRAGRSPDQIRAQFVASYGEWILLTPPRRGLSLVPWLAPGFLAAGGLALVALSVRRWTRAAREGQGPGPGADDVPEALPDADRRLVERALVGAAGELE